MSQIPNWFDRRFEFSLPLREYPNLCNRLRETPARLEELLRPVTGDALLRRPEGKWSPQEHAGHLLDLEPLWTARLDDYLAGRDALTPADLSNRKTHEADHNRHELSEILARFLRARLDFVDRASNVGPDLFGRPARHPRLEQPMRLLDHLHFVAEHDDHHLTKIREILGLKR